MTTLPAKKILQFQWECKFAYELIHGRLQHKALSTLTNYLNLAGNANWFVTKFSEKMNANTQSGTNKIPSIVRRPRSRR